MALFGQEVGGVGRTETYYRKALVARMYFGANGQQSVAAAAEEVHVRTSGGEDGNRATLELPASQLGLGVQQQGLAGDAGAAAVPDPRLKQPAAEAAAAAAAAQLAASQAAAAAAALQAQAAAQAAAAAAAAQQVQQAAAAGVAVVQQEEDTWVKEPEPVGAAAVSAWYSNIVAVTGERLPKTAQKERDISASLATAGALPLVWALLEGGRVASCACRLGGRPCGRMLSLRRVRASAQCTSADYRWSLGCRGAHAPPPSLIPAAARFPPPAPRQPNPCLPLPPPPTVTFDESAVEDHPDCKIAVLDVDKEWGHRWGAGTCDLRDPLQWPFAAPGRGIDGADSLAPEAYQYSQEHWLAQVRANCNMAERGCQ